MKKFFGICLGQVAYCCGLVPLRRTILFPQAPIKLSFSGIQPDHKPDKAQEEKKDGTNARSDTHSMPLYVLSVCHSSEVLKGQLGQSK